MKISTYFSSSCNILTMKCLIKLDSFVYLNFKLRIRIVCLVNEQAQTNKQISKILIVYKQHGLLILRWDK